MFGSHGKNELALLKEAAIGSIELNRRRPGRARQKAILGRTHNAHEHLSRHCFNCILFPIYHGKEAKIVIK
jgi:hypothetical protein